MGYKEEIDLCLEGGAMRAAFTVGVLMGLEHNGGLKFGKSGSNIVDRVLGSSAGNFSAAFAITNNLVGLRDLWLNDVTDKKFLNYSKGSLLLGNAVMDMDYLLEKVKDRGITDEKIRNAEAELIVTLTNKDTGMPFYVSNHGDHNYDMLEVLIMANSMPAVARHPFSIEGVKYSDGGTTDPFGFRYLDGMHEKFDSKKKLVIATKTPRQAESFDSLEIKFARLSQLLGRIEPGEYKAIREKHENYLSQYGLALNASKTSPEKAFFVSPASELGRFDNSQKNIQQAIWAGYNYAIKNEKLLAFFGKELEKYAPEADQ